MNILECDSRLSSLWAGKCVSVLLSHILHRLLQFIHRIRSKNEYSSSILFLIVSFLIYPNGIFLLFICLGFSNSDKLLSNSMLRELDQDARNACDHSVNIFLNFKSY